MDESRASPATQHRRRRLSYSVRTLLLLTATAAAVLAAWVVPAQHQQRAVAAIRAMGGEVGYDLLNLGATEVTDTGIAHLVRLPNLHYLVLDGTQVSDTGCNQFLKTLPTCSISRFGEGRQWVLPGPLGRLQQAGGEG